MELSWTSRALRDLDEAAEFIARDDPKAGGTMGERVLEAVDYLVEHPNLGRVGRVRGARELIVSGTPFLVIYRTRLRQVQILRVLHHARRWGQ